MRVEILTEDDSVAEDAGELTVTVLDHTGYRPVYPSAFTFSIFDNDGDVARSRCGMPQNPGSMRVRTWYSPLPAPASSRIPWTPG